MSTGGRTGSRTGTMDKPKQLATGGWAVRVKWKGVLPGGSFFCPFFGAF